MSVCAFKQSDVNRAFGDYGSQIMEMYGYSQTPDVYAPMMQLPANIPTVHVNYHCTHCAHNSYNTRKAKVSFLDALLDSTAHTEFSAEPFDSAPTVPTLPALAPTVLAPAASIPTSQPQFSQDAVVPSGPTIALSPEEIAGSDEIPREILEASHQSLLADELHRARRDSEFQSQYIKDLESALQESLHCEYSPGVEDSIQLSDNNAGDIPIAPTNIADTAPIADVLDNIAPISIANIPTATISLPNTSTATPSVQHPECMICFDDSPGAVNISFIPCGHTCCGACSSAVEICPKCATPIVGRHKFFL